MKYVIILTFAITLCYCQSRSNGIESSSKANDSTKKDTINNLTKRHGILEKLINSYGRTKVFIGLYFIKGDFFTGFSNEIHSTNLFYCSISHFFEKNVIENDSLATSIENNLQNAPDMTRGQILDKLEIWLRNDLLLSSILDDNLGEGVFFDQIISEIPETRPILKSYLKSSKQYWGSLDENESCKLYYDVNNYLTYINKKNRLIFFKKYFNLACDISLRSVK